MIAQAAAHLVLLGQHSLCGPLREGQGQPWHLLVVAFEAGLVTVWSGNGAGSAHNWWETSDVFAPGDGGE